MDFSQNFQIYFRKFFQMDFRKKCQTIFPKFSKDQGCKYCPVHGVAQRASAKKNYSEL